MGNLALSKQVTDEVWYFVLNFLNWPTRMVTLKLMCKKWHRLSGTSTHYSWLCRRLESECWLYVSPRLPVSDTWKRVYERLWRQRSLFAPRPVKVDEETGEVEHRPEKKASVDDNITVVVRFKPRKHLVGEAGEEEEASKKEEALFCLPLHQRLQLIKIRNKLENSEDALKVLFEEGGWRPGLAAAWKKTLWSNKDNKENEDGQVAASVHSVDPGMGQVVMLVPKIGMRAFNFDFVLPGRSSQSNVYETVARKMVMDFLNGFNAAIIMYGQTGAGKTYTMFGPPAASLGEVPSRMQGLIPRAVEEIFHANELRKKKGVRTVLSISYVEIFGGQVTDLLREGSRVGHNKVSAQKYVLNRNCAVEVSTLEEVKDLLEHGDAYKKKAATAMNERSSRAHALLVLNLDMEDERANVTIRSQLFLADLGGSEQVKRSKVAHGGIGLDGGFVMGQRMREAVNINVGLLALKKVTKALNEKADYIPYQDSKLTMLLSPALGGDSKAAVVVCSSMESIDAQESLAALRFGEQCSNVSNQVSQHSSGILHIIRALDTEMEELQALIKQKERWEEISFIRKDDLVEEGTYEASLAAKTGGEVVKTGKIVGAEEERKRLEQLIRRKAQLTGENVEMKLAEAGFGASAYGGKATAMGGNAELRYQDNEVDDGLKIKGKKVANWVV